MDSKKDWNLEFSKYIDNRDSKMWEAAIGLQDVDGLVASKYLIETAKEHIEGNIDIKEVEKRINNYYQELSEREDIEDCEEADKVSIKIMEILSEHDFNLSPSELLTIHKKLFGNIYSDSGKYRDYNITKKEWILNDDTVIYADCDAIEKSLEYDFKQESSFSYKNIDLDDFIKHLSRFISNIWQIHPFSEGNTRTTAIFLIMYLRTFGFDINYNVFANNSWFFRNSLVRANYKNYDKDIVEDISFLEKFLYNLLTDSNYELKNRYMHIDYKNC